MEIVYSTRTFTVKKGLRFSRPQPGWENRKPFFTVFRFASFEPVPLSDEVVRVGLCKISSFCLKSKQRKQLKSRIYDRTDAVSV
jgi:hypothetical protein